MDPLLVQALLTIHLCEKLRLGLQVASNVVAVLNSSLSFGLQHAQLMHRLLSDGVGSLDVQTCALVGFAVVSDFHLESVQVFVGVLLVLDGPLQPFRLGGRRLKSLLLQVLFTSHSVQLGDYQVEAALQLLVVRHKLLGVVRCAAI